MSARAKSGSRARLAESTVMCFSRSVSNALAATFLTLLVATGSTTVVAQDGRFPLDPPDTASPRGTLFNLIDNVAEAYRVLAAAKRDYAATPSLFKGDAVLEQEARAEGLLRRAAESLDLNQVSPVIRRHVSLEAALQLKEVLDRIQLDRTVITVPNAAFADMQIINWARCDRMLILATIGLRYETKPEQLRYVLAKLREMFLAHPEIDNDTRRIRFLGYGSSSLEIQIRVYALTRDWNEFYAIQEDVMLRVGEIVEQAGTSFAFPSQTLYVRRDDGLDKERSDAAMHQVQSWRSAGQLPFPHMASSHRERLADTLDYPPRGSPDARDQQTPHAETAEPLSEETEGDGQPGDQPGDGDGF